SRSPLSSYTLSLHDALPISLRVLGRQRHQRRTVILVVLRAVGNTGKALQRKEVLGIAFGPRLQHLARLFRRSCFQLQIGKHERRSEEHTSELQSRSDLVCRL